MQEGCEVFASRLVRTGGDKYQLRGDMPLNISAKWVAMGEVAEVGPFHLNSGIAGCEECQQVGVELVFVRFGDAMRGTGINLQRGVLDEFGRGVSRGADRHDLVVVAVDNQGWHVELLEVLREVRLGKRPDAVELVLETALHGPKPECVPNALADLRARSVGAEERRGEILEELRAVGGDAGADGIKLLERQAGRIGMHLEDQWRHRAHQYNPGDAFGAVASDIAGDFPSAGRVPDQSDT